MRSQLCFYLHLQWSVRRGAGLARVLVSIPQAGPLVTISQGWTCGGSRTPGPLEPARGSGRDKTATKALVPQAIHRQGSRLLPRKKASPNGVERATLVTWRGGRRTNGLDVRLKSCALSAWERRGAASWWQPAYPCVYLGNEPVHGRLLCPFHL